MAATIRVLGQAYPTATVETDLYTCSTTSAVISTLVICNTSGSTSDAFSVRVCIGGAADVAEQLLFSATSIPASTTVFVTIGVTVSSTDVIRVNSANGTCAFNLFGQENA